MKTVEQARPLRSPGRCARLLIFLLGFAFPLGLSTPALAGLGDLVEEVVDELPVVGGVVDDTAEPIVEVADPIPAPVVDDALGDVEPFLEDAVDSVRTPAPVIEEVLDPEIDEEAPSAGGGIGGVEADNPRSGQADDVFSQTELAVSEPRPIGSTNEVSTIFDGEGSILVARTLQAALATTGRLAPVARTPGEPAGVGWLIGLTDWLKSTAADLADLLFTPLRLLEVLARALLTAGVGLVAPASLALTFILYAARDRRWERLRAARLD
jgi:hypothetical protein